MRRGPNKPRYQGTNADAVVARAKKERATGDGAFGRIAPLSQDALRKFIDAGLCPWCGRGPWKVLALHVHNKHGLDRHELRRMAGLSREDSICDPAVSDRVRKQRRADGILPPPAARVVRHCTQCGGAIPRRGTRNLNRNTCSEACERARRSEVSRKTRAAQPRLTAWSRTVAACVECGSSEREHAARGLCLRCYERERSRRRVTTRRAGAGVAS